MKRILMAATGALMLLSATAQEGKQVNGGPILTIDKEVHDYGTIQQHANGTCEFTVTNTGDAPLIITNCKGSCGCTVPKCEKAPIQPGATSTITVKYDTKRIGPINKTVTISSNATNAPSKLIRIKGTVEAASQGPTSPVKEQSPMAPVEKSGS